MILLTSTGDIIRIITSAAGAVDAHASSVDNNAGVVTPVRLNTASITTATTTTIVTSPASGQQRAIKALVIYNTHATVVNTITVQHSDGTLIKQIYKGTLQAGEGVWITDYSPSPTIILANGSIKSNDNTNATITGGNISGVTFSSAAATITGGAISGTPITAIAGTTTVPALTITAGTLNTTPASGAVESDGVVPYITPITSERGVINSRQFIRVQGGTRTLASQTAAQKMFGTPTNGALTVGGSRTYRFECAFSLSSMSATSGSFGFAIGGTATLTSIYWISEASKPAAALTTAAAAVNTVNSTAANTTIVTASTGVVGFARIRGLISVNATGTIIPQISLGVAAAAVLAQDSYFECWPIGTNTVVNVGNWS